MVRLVLGILRAHCDERFGGEWHLSPEQSLWLDGERTVIPDQVVVNSPKGTNNEIKPFFGTSLYDLKVAAMPAAANLVMRDGLRLFSPAASLAGVGETFFARNPVESQVVLASLADASDLLRLLLDGGNSTKAGYLAGASRRIGRASGVKGFKQTDAAQDLEAFGLGQFVQRNERLALPTTKK